MRRILLYLNFLALVSFSLLWKIPTRLPPSTTKKYSIRQLDLKCFNVDEKFMQVEKCEIKAKRGTNGILNVIVHYRGITDIRVSTQLFYRGTSGRYQPFIINVNFDMCKWVEEAASNVVIRAALDTVMTQFDSTIFEGCPLQGPFNLSNWNVEDDYDRLIFVKILPEGTFRFNVRAFDSKNKTYIEAYNIVSIRAVGTQDAYKMG